MRLNKMLTLLSTCVSLMVPSLFANDFGDLEVSNQATAPANIKLSTVKKLDTANDAESISSTDLDKAVSGINSGYTFTKIDDALAPQLAASIAKKGWDILKYINIPSDILYSELKKIHEANTAANQADFEIFFYLTTLDRNAAGKNVDKQDFQQANNYAYPQDKDALIQPNAPAPVKSVAPNPRHTVTKEEVRDFAAVEKFLMAQPQNRLIKRNEATRKALIQTIQDMGYTKNSVATTSEDAFFIDVLRLLIADAELQQKLIGNQAELNTALGYTQQLDYPKDALSIVKN